MPMEELEYYNKVSESIKLIFDLTSRIDERVKILVEQHNITSERIEKLHERHENMLNRVVALENKNGTEVKHKLEDLKERLDSVEDRAENLIKQVEDRAMTLATQSRDRTEVVDKRLRESEIKIAAIEINTNLHGNKWKMAGEFVFKVAVLLIGALITWKVSGK